MSLGQDYEVIFLLGITLNKDKPRALETLKMLTTMLQIRCIPFVMLDREHNLNNLPSINLIFVLGGDGTLLNAARKFASLEAPFIAINAGHLGFLSEADPENLEALLDTIADSNYRIEKRLMLFAYILRGEETIKVSSALNDICVIKDPLGRMIKCCVKMNNLNLGTYSGDGVIVSTPTGSTAYSLSCGGPLVYPETEVILLTPICPHMLSSRPLVLPANSEVTIQVSNESYGMNIVADGQVSHTLEAGDIVYVSKYTHNIKLIKWSTNSFFDVVTKKLYPKA